MTIKHYNKAPLPFTGQKRNFIKPFKAALANIPNDGAGWTIVDAFGGSGLLAHVAKRCKPAARVIYNDFDGYAKRIHNIPDVNRLRHQLLPIVQHLPRNGLLDHATKAKIIAVIQDFNSYVDLHSLCSWFLFSSQQAASLDEFFDRHFYNGIRLSDIPSADDYLEGLEITHDAFDQLLPQFYQQDKTLLILDPPYVSTNQGAYAQHGYFGMVKFLRLMAWVRPPFIFFSSTRSELMDYLDLLKDTQPEIYQANFAGMVHERLNVQTAKGVQYEDNMLIKF